jgi:hypothetical protein
VDCVIQPPRWNKPLPIEIKTKYQKVIDLMKVGAKGPDDNHVFQFKVQLALVYLDQTEGRMWSNLDPVTHGYIYYISAIVPLILPSSAWISTWTSSESASSA